MSSPKFPLNPSDGDEILDKYGNRWTYQEHVKSWISKGKIESFNIVTDNNDGLVDPITYEKLEKLKTLASNYDLKSSLKIRPGVDAYWYYFKSSDKLIRFITEGESQLRVEVDKARLFQILYKNRRPGLRGEEGDQGLPGENGISGNTLCDVSGGEPGYKASSVIGNQLNFSIYTPLALTLEGPITLPNNHVPDISVRLYKILDTPDSILVKDPIKAFDTVLKQDQYHSKKYEHIKNLLYKQSMGMKIQSGICDIPLSPVITSLSNISQTPYVTIDIDPTNIGDIRITTASNIAIDTNATKASIKYDSDTGIICGTIVLLNSEWNINEWCIKSRQRGPDGDQGYSGAAYIQINVEDLDSSNIHATCPIVNIRHDNRRNILFTHCTDLLQEHSVSKVRILPDSSSVNVRNAVDSVFASAQKILDDSKYVCKFTPELKDIKVPKLDLVHWEPQPGIFVKRHFNKHKFDWIPRTDIPACDSQSKWYGVEDVRPGKYPWGIKMPKAPANDECNQEPFFYFPALQDTPCPGEPPLSQVKEGGSYTPAVTNTYLTQTSTIDGGIY